MALVRRENFQKDILLMKPQKGNKTTVLESATKKNYGLQVTKKKSIS